MYIVLKIMGGMKTFLAMIAFILVAFSHAFYLGMAGKAVNGIAYNKEVYPNITCDFVPKYHWCFLAIENWVNTTRLCTNV